MIAIDTNVLVRLLTNDDPVQSPRAAALVASEDVFVAKTVLLETEWVLRFSYSMGRSTIHAAFTRLLATPTITLEAATAIGSALGSYEAGLDFADALHVASSSTAEKFVTFDHKLARAAARSRTIPRVETA